MGYKPRTTLALQEICQQRDDILDHVREKDIDSLKSVSFEVIKKVCSFLDIYPSGDRRKKDSWIEAIFNYIETEVSDREYPVLVTNEDSDDVDEDSTEVEEVKLTPDQEVAKTKINEFLASDRRFFRLTGYAGSGKTFLLIQVIKQLQDAKILFACGAPTNKASRNLRSLASEHGLKANVTTLAKLLGQQPEIDESSGIQTFVSSLESTLGSYPVVILDEYSMINRSNFEDICDNVRGSLKKTKVIFSGDRAQLPPVKELEPIIATDARVTDGATLSTVVRYDGEIAGVAEEIRSDPDYNQKIYPFETSSDETIHCLDRHRWLTKAAELFKSQEFQDNPDHVRFISWTNRTAKALNEYVRGELWGSSVNDYVKGDRLIAKTPCFREDTKKKGKDRWVIIMGASEECEVVETPELVKIEYSPSKPLNLTHWLIPVRTDDSNLTLRVLTDESESLRQKHMKQLKEFRKWRDFYDCLKMYDSIFYSYALTCHKAQGSSIDHVFIDTKDMRYCPDLAKITYTALTRAKVRAYIPI